MSKALWALLIVSVIALPVSAHDLLPPDWRGSPGTSTVVYDNFGDTYDYFTDYGGGLAPPEIHYECTDHWDFWNSPIFGGPDFGWKLPWTWRDCRMVFNLDNYDSDNMYKDIRVQVTFYAPNFYEYYDPWCLNVWACSDKSWDPEHPELWDCDSVWNLEYEEIELVSSYNGWVCAAFDLQLSPNPDSETIALQFSDWPWWYYPTGYWTYPNYGGHIYIDQVVIDTRCSDVPEPSMFCLLAAGGAMLLCAWRRRKT